MHDKELRFSQLSVLSEQPNASLFGLNMADLTTAHRFFALTALLFSGSPISAVFTGYLWIACVGCLQQLSDINQRFACG
jgi:hypothetical protein